MKTMRRRSHDYRIPKATIEAVYERSGGRCEGDTYAGLGHVGQYFADRCAAKGTEMHHVTYGDDEGDIRGREKPEHLQLVCRSCHEAEHRSHFDMNGTYWANKEEMDTYWWYYHEQMERG